MKVMRIKAAGGPEVLEQAEMTLPAPNEGAILIRVKAAGVNRPDVSQRKGHYPPPPGASPDVPGLEVAGVIDECGPGVTQWKPGDRVCALLTGGGYAEYALASEGCCLPVPSGWTFEEAASLPETVFTVWHNVFQRGKLQKGENFLVHGGSSGIGITAIQLAKAFGATVFTTAGSIEKCMVCRSLGADRCIVYKDEDFEAILAAEGADVILDMVGGDYIPKNLNLLREEGRLVFINTMRGSEAVINASLIMRKRLLITGSTLRNRDEAFKSALAGEIRAKVWPLLESGRFKPVIYKIFPLEQAAEAHRLMESSEHIGKIVLTVTE